MDVLAMSSSVYSGGGGAVGVGWSGLSQFDILSFGLSLVGMVKWIFCCLDFLCSNMDIYIYIYVCIYYEFW